MARLVDLLAKHVDGHLRRRIDRPIAARIGLCAVLACALPALPISCLAPSEGMDVDERTQSQSRQEEYVYTPEVAPIPPPPSDDRRDERFAMVSEQIEARGIHDPDVLAAMRTVRRHEFIPATGQYAAYADRPVHIGHDQTISQPYIVALMTELLEVEKGDKVLEIGTGSGYQAAVLAEMGVDVYSIEIVEPLADRARSTLREQGYDVAVRAGDGYDGWPTEAPFDGVILTAAPQELPPSLGKQLKVGGHLVAPVGDWQQQLEVLTRTETGFERKVAAAVRFVPMTGEAEEAH